MEYTYEDLLEIRAFVANKTPCTPRRQETFGLAGGSDGICDIVREWSDGEDSRYESN